MSGSDDDGLHDSAEYGVLYYRVLVLERKMESLQGDVKELEETNAKWVNRAIGIGLVISCLGASGGYILAALRKLGL